MMCCQYTNVQKIPFDLEGQSKLSDLPLFNSKVYVDLYSAFLRKAPHFTVPWRLEG